MDGKRVAVEVRLEFIFEIYSNNNFEIQFQVCEMVLKWDILRKKKLDEASRRVNPMTVSTVPCRYGRDTVGVLKEYCRGNVGTVLGTTSQL